MLGSGTFSDSATAETTTTGAPCSRARRVRFEQRVERCDAQADEVRRRREVRLVGDAAARIEADGPRRSHVRRSRGEVARLAVVAGDDEQRLGGILLCQRGDDVGLQRLRDERVAALAGERASWPGRRRA